MESGMEYLPTPRRAFATLMFITEVLFWSVLTLRFINLFYGVILSIFLLLSMIASGYPPVYALVGFPLALIINPRRRLLKIKERRFAFWKLKANNMGRL
jgi:hypothetical protein